MSKLNILEAIRMQSREYRDSVTILYFASLGTLDVKIFHFLWSHRSVKCSAIHPTQERVICPMGGVITSEYKLHEMPNGQRTKHWPSEVLMQEMQMRCRVQLSDLMKMVFGIGQANGL